LEIRYSNIVLSLAIYCCVLMAFYMSRDMTCVCVCCI